MIEKLVAFEERLTRIEAALLVGVVIFMLLLAVYNVFYRNALIPLQVSVVENATVEVEVPIESGGDDFGGGFGQPDESTGGFGGGFGEEPAADEEDGASGFGGGFGDEADSEVAADSADDGAAGFGGGFGEEADSEAVEEPADDGASGFGGGFGDEADSKEAEEPADDGAAGFGGGFDDSDEAGDSDEAAGFGGGFGDSDEEGDGAEGFGGGFGDEASDEADTTKDKPDRDAPKMRIERRPPAEGSFAKTLADAIDAVKLEWIDVVLRQLVLVIGFLGSMLATRRRKHITIDALSKILPVGVLPWTQVLTNLLSIIVCVFLTLAGWGLVEIGLEFPKELTWFAEEWVFQLVFPVGFGLLSFHFGVRLIESVAWGLTGEPVGTIELEPRPTATSATAGDLDPDGGDLVASSLGTEDLAVDGEEEADPQTVAPDGIDEPREQESATDASAAEDSATEDSVGKGSGDEDEADQDSPAEDSGGEDPNEDASSEEVSK